MTEEEGRAAIVREARTWIGTPYHPEGRVKGAGTDCGMLIAEVYERAGILAHVPVPHYAPDWNKHHKSEEYLKIILRYGHQVHTGKPGDVAMYKFAGVTRSHGAIIVSWPTVIHATFREGKVWECDLSDYADFANRKPIFFSFW